MTKRYGLLTAALALAFAAALLFGGFIPALAQDGEDGVPEDVFPCPMWGAFDGDLSDLPDGWDSMPYGRGYGHGMMWQFYNGEDLPDDWAERLDEEGLPPFGPGMMWSYYNSGEELPEEWQAWFDAMPEDMPVGPMMWQHYNGEDLPEDYAEWFEACPMYNAANGGAYDGAWGPGMMGRGRGGMRGGRGPGMMWQ